ncbi:conserved hypothetical protein (plasmid) [Pseudarthrobacter chlorophenolicus A6]|uniref:DUF8175 domain-containing protein n=1 Tax=Pseudarthrobacter chlorophenolicus (strain ATCC 700700 / DSM 12829 / CIP 107037 / JCM 12360 / KCTC 9906 / NCIMB 13794 / A6) TaxID=452863 RepID=B8HJA9_PSECP|nr:hypothetical protein [Pseudarthrobacter chlorophenolicus]ACL42507.1 conserved hypothetical protein [Pseudarthrobacter chlorophenolicus A6]SDQ10265.1 hypothetical protein SAMN04489738_0120 [Pseudarthrobacter chlorophenolicus]
MNQSTESTTESNPFTKPGFIIAAALVVALIASTIVIFLLPKGQGNAEPAPPSGEPTGSVAATPSASAGAEASVCGLPSSSETALGAAPETKWELVGSMAAPTDPKVGPGKTDDQGIRSCFAHTPTGALYAAVNLWALGSDPSKERAIAQQLVAKGIGRDAGMKAPQTAAPPSSVKIQIAGFNVSYTSAQAVVELAFTADNGALASVRTNLLWQDGDWKGVVADNGAPLEEPRQIRDLSGFIPWSGA